jgi:HK97 gp10 family phage protein
MISLQITSPSLDRLREALKRAPEKVVHEIEGALKKSGTLIANTGFKEAPVNKLSGGGQLKQNIRPHLLSKTRLEVISHAPYSHFVEKGTGIYAGHTKFLGKIPGVGWRWIKGMKANPFMRRTYEKTKEKIGDYFREALRNVFNSLK